MLAVFKTGGKQYSVKSGQILKVEKLNGSQGDSVYFNDVLAVSDASDHTIGSPLIKGAIVEAKILEQIRDKKIIVFKKRRRQNYRHTQGHRQYLTVLQIESISVGNKKSKTPTKEVKKQDKVAKNSSKEEMKKAAVKKTTVKKKAAVKKTTVKKKAVKKIG
jgi:large subunit ribosomal protein L21